MLHLQAAEIDTNQNVRGKVKAILRDSFCGFLKVRIMPLALSSSRGDAWVPLTGE